MSRSHPPPRRSPSPDMISSRSSRSRSQRGSRSRYTARAIHSPPQEPQGDSDNHESSPIASQDPPVSRSINLVIDSEGHGTFHIATRGLAPRKSSGMTPAFPGRSKKSCQDRLAFDVQIDEATRRYLIHTSMGRLDRIRAVHPGMNILRTLSYWNGLQRRRYGDNPTEVVKGGTLGIASRNRSDTVMMTLTSEYGHRAWERDEVFQRELERFVEDALQFHLCLNGDDDGDRHGGPTGGRAGKEDDGGSAEKKKGRSLHEHIFNGGNIAPPPARSPTSSAGTPKSIGSGALLPQTEGEGEDPPTPAGATPTSGGGAKRRNKLLGKVLQKVIRD